MPKHLKVGEPASQHILTPACKTCHQCAGPLWIAYHTSRRVITLNGICQLTIKVRRCQNRSCPRYHCPYRPEEEGSWALPHGEFGLEIIALIGMLRYQAH